MPFCCEFLPPASFLYLIVASNPRTINIHLFQYHINECINIISMKVKNWQSGIKPASAIRRESHEHHCCQLKPGVHPGLWSNRVKFWKSNTCKTFHQQTMIHLCRSTCSTCPYSQPSQRHIFLYMFQCRRLKAERILTIMFSQSFLDLVPEEPRQRKLKYMKPFFSS